MPNPKNVHVTPHPDGWATKTEGATRPSHVFSTQQKAIEAGRQQAKQNAGELVIHNRQGQIRAKDSYGNDKFPPKG
jgi:hypothetical protein